MPDVPRDGLCARAAAGRVLVGLGHGTGRYAGISASAHRFVTEDESTMRRINTNVGSLIAQRVLGQQTQGLSKSLARLSTGYRINRGGDDPAGLIISERLRSEKNAI